MIQKKLNKRPCKQCSTEFQKEYSLQMFCSSPCASKYNRAKTNEKHSVKKSKEQTSSQPNLKESVIFKEIWDSFPPEKRNSFVTGKPLSDQLNARAWYFSHILPKGKAKYPMFKFYKKNIVLKEFAEHEAWEYKKYELAGDPLWEHVFALRYALLKEYEKHLKLFNLGLVEYYKID